VPSRAKSSFGHGALGWRRCPIGIDREAQRGYRSSAVVPLGAMMTSSAWRASADA
jgi:hypothetical protein